MAKSTVATVISDIKGSADYDIVDTGLDTLIVKWINFALKRMKQWFLDEGMYRQIGASSTLSTVANQEFIDISSLPADLDETIQLTERENDSPIPVIPFAEYRKINPDPSSTSSSTPDIAAIFADRLYLYPRPNQILTLHIDYTKLITKVTSAGNIPFDDKYDEIIVAIGIEYLVKFLDRNNATAIITAKNDVDDLYKRMIVGAAKNIGMSRGSASRRAGIPYFSPRKVV